MRHGQEGNGKVNIDILGISELKWTRMGKFNSDDHYIFCCRQESLKRNRIVLTVNNRVWDAVLGCNLKNDRMILVHFQGKTFSITVIQVYAPSTTGKTLQYSFLENPMNRMKRQKDRTLKDELPRSIGAEYATGDQWRNSCRRMKRQSQSKNNTQLWIWLVMKVKSDAVKNNIA